MRPSDSFCDRKYSIIDSFCFAEFITYYSLIYNPRKTNKGEEYQIDLLPDSLMEGNYKNLHYAKIIKLINSNEKMQCQKVRPVPRYHTPNKYIFPKKYAHHLLYFPFWSKEEFLGKLAEPDVMDIIKITNKSLSIIWSWLTRHMKTSIKNLLTTKMLMVKLKITKHVNQNIVSIQSQLNRVHKLMSQIWHQEISCQKYQLITKLLEILEALIKNNIWCLMSYSSRQKTM